MKNLIRVLTAASFLAAFAAGCGKKEEKPEEIVRPVKTVVVGGSQEFVRNYPGKVQGSQRVEMAFRKVSGPLTELPVKEGDQVKQGQLLARIDLRDYQIAYAEEKAKYDKAVSDYNRYVSLYEEDAVSAADLELQRAQRDVAKAKLDNAAAALGDTELKAPFDGIIGELYVENFTEIKANQPILSLHDVSRVEIMIDLPEGLVSSIEKKNNPYELFAVFEKSPGVEYPLELKEFAARADPTTQTYKATFIMDQPSEISVLPGMTANVRGRLKPGAKNIAVAMTLPSSAVLTDESGRSTVWVVDEATMTVRARQVEAGDLVGSGDIRIKSGIEKGERVVTAGASSLRENMKVRLIDEGASKIVE